MWDGQNTKSMLLSTTAASFTGCTHHRSRPIPSEILLSSQVIWFCSPVTADEAVLSISSQTSPISRTQNCRYKNLGHKWRNLETHCSVTSYTKYHWQHYYLLSSSVTHTCHTQPARPFSKCSLNNIVSGDWFLQIFFPVRILDPAIIQLPCPVAWDFTGFKAPCNVLHHQLGKWQHAVAGSKLSVWWAGKFANVLASRQNGSNSCWTQTAACLSAVAVIWTSFLYLLTNFYKICPPIPLLYLM